MKKKFTLTVKNILKNVLVLAFWIWAMGLIYVGLQRLGGAKVDATLLLETLPYLAGGAVLYCLLWLSAYIRK
ncbi:MAG: hypothetical protein IJ099_04060 [Alphaproteobacteria bacterium]|nr:hypothetical protein [Alphaproteobacteria bacterium]